MATLNGLGPYLLRHRWVLLLSLIFFVGTNCSALLGPLLLGLAIDSLRHVGDHSSLLLFAALLVGAAALQGVLEFGARYTNNSISRQIEYELRNDIFAHFQKLELAYFQQRTI